MSWLMNGPLVVLALGALLLGWLAHGWMGDMVGHSSAAVAGAVHGAGPEAAAGAEAHAGGLDAHTLVSLVTGIGGIVMIALAGYFFWLNRAAAEKIGKVFGPIRTFLENKWYIDELYHAVIVMPLRALGWICYLFDRLIIDGLIIDGLLRYTPRLAGEAQTPAARGLLQGFALAMVLGVVVVLAIVLWAMK